MNYIYKNYHSLSDYLALILEMPDDIPRYYMIINYLFPNHDVYFHYYSNNINKKTNKLNYD
jgi:hypothetical protein